MILSQYKRGEKMIYDKADSDKLNSILEKKTFRNGSIFNNEVEAKTGLSIEHLILCWIFSSRNNFKKALTDWKENGTIMNYNEIQILRD